MYAVSVRRSLYSQFPPPSRVVRQEYSARICESPALPTGLRDPKAHPRATPLCDYRLAFSTMNRNSSAGATFLGPCPHQPFADERVRLGEPATEAQNFEMGKRSWSGSVNRRASGVRPPRHPCRQHLVLRYPWTFSGRISPDHSSATDVAVCFVATSLFEGSRHPVFVPLRLQLPPPGAGSQSRAGSPVPRTLRRLTGLAVLGLAHGMLLYFGDILLTYAVIGLILLGLREHWPAWPRSWPRWVSPLAMGALLIAVGAVVAAVNAPHGVSASRP